MVGVVPRTVGIAPRMVGIAPRSCLSSLHGHSIPWHPPSLSGMAQAAGGRGQGTEGGSAGRRAPAVRGFFCLAEWRGSWSTGPRQCCRTCKNRVELCQTKAKNGFTHLKIPQHTLGAHSSWLMWGHPSQNSGRTQPTGWGRARAGREGLVITAPVGSVYTESRSHVDVKQYADDVFGMPHPHCCSLLIAHHFQRVLFPGIFVQPRPALCLIESHNGARGPSANAGGAWYGCCSQADLLSQREDHCH